MKSVVQDGRRRWTLQGRNRMGTNRFDFGQGEDSFCQRRYGHLVSLGDLDEFGSGGFGPPLAKAKPCDELRVLKKRMGWAGTPSMAKSVCPTGVTVRAKCTHRWWMCRLSSGGLLQGKDLAIGERSTHNFVDLIRYYKGIGKRSVSSPHLRGEVIVSV